MNKSEYLHLLRIMAKIIKKWNDMIEINMIGGPHES